MAKVCCNLASFCDLIPNNSYWNEIFSTNNTNPVKIRTTQFQKWISQKCIFAVRNLNIIYYVSELYFTHILQNKCITWVHFFLKQITFIMRVLVISTEHDCKCLSFCKVHVLAEILHSLCSTSTQQYLCVSNTHRRLFQITFFVEHACACCYVSLNSFQQSLKHTVNTWFHNEYCKFLYTIS